MNDHRHALSDVTGIGPATAHVLTAHGLDSAAALTRVPLETLAAVPGFGIARATRVRQAATLLLGGDASAGARTPTTARAVKTNGARSTALAGAVGKTRTGKKARKAEKKAAKTQRKTEKAERKQAKRAAKAERKQAKLTAKAERAQAKRAIKAERKQAKLAAKAERKHPGKARKAGRKSA